jgi:predicted HD superfamily hydrolase involved in NAD metabolism
LQENRFSLSSVLDPACIAPFRALVESMVTPSRFQHIMRVARLAHSIAVGNGFDDDECEATLLAAVLHDAARDLPTNELFELAPPRDEMESCHPMAVHGRAGRRLAERWGVKDDRVLGAIAGHVLGVGLDERVGMAVYVADVSEPGRGVNDDIRALAICDLESAYRRAVDSKVRYLLNSGKIVHPDTLKVYEAIHNG